MFTMFVSLYLHNNKNRNCIHFMKVSYLKRFKKKKWKVQGFNTILDSLVTSVWSWLRVCYGDYKNFNGHRNQHISRLCSWLYSNGIRYDCPGSEKAFMVFENVVTLSKINLVTVWSLDFRRKFLSTENEVRRLLKYFGWLQERICPKVGLVVKEKRNDNGEYFASKWDA